jgi:hypothetical protein
MNIKSTTQRGTITPALLIIASSFVIVIYALVFILALQFDFSRRQLASDMAIQIAEAGVNYYRWHLDQAPSDYQDGTGTSGPYVHDYYDPEGGKIGEYSLEITPPEDSSQTVTIDSIGWTTQFPSVKRKIRTQYGKLVLTKYAFLHNSNMWFGNDITVTGPVFSNGGIRQDGTNTSTVESSRSIYTCGLETGCTSPEEKPGVWGNGKTKSLWSYPVTPIDFESIKVDFSSMKSSAQSNGLYLGPSGAQGYHLIFVSDGTVNVYKVTGTSSVLGYSLEGGCESMQQDIVSETILGNYSLSSAPIIFVEDNLWVEGVVKGKTTVAAAVFPLGTFDTTIWIPNNLTYLAKDGANKLGLVSENDIVFVKDVPEYFYLDGALLAQNGRVIRHHYGYFGCKSGGTDKNKKEFNFYGSIISNLRSYWNHASGPKSPASGFVKTTLDYDPTNFDNPPPYFPAFGGYQFISWKEVKP